jgi:hypothetical protein
MMVAGVCCVADIAGVVHPTGVQNCADMVALAAPHVCAHPVDLDRDALGGEGLLHRDDQRDRAEIHHRARPVEHYRRRRHDSSPAAAP